MRLYWSFSEAWPDRASPLERIPGDNFRVRSSADHREAKKINGKGLSRNENRNHAAACNRALVGVGTDSARREPEENHFGCFDASPARNGPASSSKPERAKAASTIACAFGHGEEHGPGGTRRGVDAGAVCSREACSAFNCRWQNFVQKAGRFRLPDRPVCGKSFRRLVWPDRT